MSSLRRLDILLGTLEVMNEESEPLGLWVSWVKTKIQAFNDILDAVILSVPVWAIMLRSRRDSLTLAGQQTSGSGLGSLRFTGSWGVALPLPVREDESPSLQVLGASSPALWM